MNELSRSIRTSFGEQVQIFETGEGCKDVRLQLKSEDPLDQWQVSVILSQKNIMELMYELAKVKLKNEERT
jgi:hypothetical protein